MRLLILLLLCTPCFGKSVQSELDKAVRAGATQFVIGNGRDTAIVLGQTLLIPDNVTVSASGNVMLICRGEYGVEFTGSGSTLRGFRINGGEMPTENRSRHGVVNAFRNTVEHCHIENFAGNGIHTEADIHGGTNANGAIYRDNIITLVWNGIYLKGGDANHILTTRNSIFDCTQWSIWDASFLGSIHTENLSENSAFRTYNKTLVSHQGVRYAARQPMVVGVEPGVGNWQGWWARRGEGGVNGYWKEWNPRDTFIFGGDYAATDPNNTAVFANCYNEDGEASPNLAGGHAVFMGGRAARKVEGASMWGEHGAVKMTQLRIGENGYTAGVSNGFYQQLRNDYPVRWGNNGGLTGWNWAGMDNGWWSYNVNRQTPNKILGRGEGELGFETDWRLTPELHKVQDGLGSVVVSHCLSAPLGGKDGDIAINSAWKPGAPFQWVKVEGEWVPLVIDEKKKRPAYKSHKEADADNELKPGDQYLLKTTRGVYVKP